MKADIIHISGFDTYHTHDSGNYIVFDFLRKLKLDSKMILALNKSKPDVDTFFIPKDKIIEQIEEAKIIVIHDSLFDHHEIKQLHQKLNCKFIFISQDHSLIATNKCTGNLSYPDLNPEKVNEQNKTLILEKKDTFSSLPITVVNGSTYSKNVFKNSPIYKDKNFELIPLPADVPYCSSPKETVRKYLNLNEQKFYIFWGTTQPKTERKGKKIFDRCLDKLWNKMTAEEREKIVILNAGPNAGKFGNNSSFKALPLGYQKTRKDMSVYYRASTISVCTTISDAGPMMISESMCNETPVIAFDRSISCDLCIDEQTGYLIKDLDEDEMAEKIYKILFIDNNTEMSKKSRNRYLIFHDENVILNKWKDLFVKLME